MTIYEVQKFGVTLEWTTSLEEAEAAFKDTSNGEAKLYRIVNSKKHLLRMK